MSRYHRDPEQRRVAALRDEHIAWARQEERKGGWITYLIRDPRFPDKKGNPAGTPIYVGQTKEFGTRVYSRFMKSEKEATEQHQDTIQKRVTELLHAGLIAEHEVLERLPTRLASLISETNWARECVRRGYDIANRLPLQKNAGPPITGHDIPTGWLWQFTLVEAIEDRLVLDLLCRSCRVSVQINLDAFRHTAEPPKELYQIKANGFWRREPCTGCGQTGGRVARLVVPN